LWCFSTCRLSGLFHAFKSLALAIRMPFREAWFGGNYEKQIREDGEMGIRADGAGGRAGDFQSGSGVCG
jgi:hypothetical protein